MRIICLSDHPGDMLREARDRQRRAQEQADAGYAARLAAHQSRIQEARAWRDEVRRQQRWLTWLGAVVKVWAEEAQSPRPDLVDTGSSHEEEILTAGMAGERRVESALGRVLDDAWVLFRGYKNRGGEIDHLLVGPRGVFAMEGKHRNATVHVDGDRWTYDKYDRFGNLVAQGKLMRDVGGRSPSMQVNAPADELRQFLRSRGQDIQIERIVVLTHDRSELGSYSNLTVTVTNSTDYLINMVSNSAVTLDATRTAAIERLIQQDHHFHKSRVRQKPASPQRPAKA